MGNIQNHNRHTFMLDLCGDDYWDFHLCINNSYGFNDDLSDKCLSAYIDISNSDCVWFDDLYSIDKYKWEGSVSNGLKLENFGFTSVDNGRTFYDKTHITNKQFFDLYTKTEFNINENNHQLSLTKIRGNQQLYDYSNEIVFEDDLQVSRLNGGWYQGFFCANDGTDYKVLPTDIDSGWTFEFVLKKHDLANSKKRLNDEYPENKGIFFYIGTRAENKWWTHYVDVNNFQRYDKRGLSNEYVSSEYIDDIQLNIDYLTEVYQYEKKKKEWEYSKEYLIYDEDESKAFTDEYIDDNYYGNNNTKYVEDDYIEKDLEIDENTQIVTKDGHDLYTPNVKLYKTDNKFLFFDRTCDGLTTDKWTPETEMVMSYIAPPKMENYFTLLNRGCNGYDINSLKKIIDIKSREYNVLDDLYRNAFALQIKDDGSIGYKYMVKDCDSEAENYKIESEFSNTGVITPDEWCTIHVKILPVIHKSKNLNCINNNPSTDKMQIIFYVNGKIIMVSKELPMLNLKKLNDLNDKQEGVPFNISLGGGTQGLCETVDINYKKLPEYKLPLEKEFGGSFIGFLKSFKFYTCDLNFTQLQYNFLKNNNIY